jgi:hypothetical protein
MLRLGSVGHPIPDWLWLAVQLVCIGVPATVVLTYAVMDVLTPARLEALRRSLLAHSWRTSLIGLGIAGAVIPYLLRVFVLQHAPLTDDESSYLLSARLLSSGRLFVVSPKLPVFFDNGFIVNDGRLYGQYFLGWPALLAVGLWVHAASLVNPILQGITTLGMAHIAARRWGTPWGLVTGLLVLSSPFLMMNAATGLAHTSCLCALTLLLLSVQAAEREDAPATLGIAVGLCFCAAFWIRPATAVGVGAPMLWTFVRTSLRHRKRIGHLGTLCTTAFVGAALFLLTNHALTGSALSTGYHARFENAVETGFRFVAFHPESGDRNKFLFFFTEHSPTVIISRCLIAWSRLWVDAHGWPMGLSLAFLASRADWRWLLGPIVGLFAAHFTLRDAGIDSFGPVHYTELMLPLVLLLTGGTRALWQWSRRHGPTALAPSLVVANAICSLLYFVPLRIGTVAALARDVRAPLEAAAAAPKGSVVFTRIKFAPSCAAMGSENFVNFRPDNSPDFTDEPLWANHINLALDRKLVTTMQRQRGYLLAQTTEGCRWKLIPLEQASEADFPQSVELLPGDLGEVPRKR